MPDSIDNAYLNTRSQREQPRVEDLTSRLQRMVEQEQAPAGATQPSPTSASAPMPTGPAATLDATAAPAKSPGFFKETKRAVVGGVRDAGQATLDLIDDVGRWSDNNLIDLRMGSASFGKLGGAKSAGNEHTTGELKSMGIALPEATKNESTGGNIARSITQFLVPYTGWMKAARVVAPGVKLAVRAAGAGAVTDATAFDPHQERASNLILHLTDNEPLVGKPILQYLAADPNDSNAEGRFKNALEGLGIGQLAEGLFVAFRATKAKFIGEGKKPMEEIEKARVTPEQAAEQATAVKERLKPEDLSLRQQIDTLTGANQKAPRDVYQKRLDAVAAFKGEARPITATKDYGNLSAGKPAIDPLKAADGILQKPGAAELKLASEATDAIPYQRPVAPPQVVDTIKLIEEEIAKNPEKVHNVYMDPQGGLVFSKKQPSPTALPLEQTVKVSLAKPAAERTAEDLITIRAYRQLQEAAFPGLIKPGAVAPHEIHPVEVVRSRARPSGAAPDNSLDFSHLADEGPKLKSGEKITIEQSADGPKRTPDQQELANLNHTPNAGDFTLYARDSKGNVIGHLELSRKDGSMVVEPKDVKVNDTHRRQGVATALYDKAKEMGFNVQQSQYQTADGRALRAGLQQRGFVSPQVLANLASAQIGGLAGWNSAEDDATFAEKMSLAGMGALGGLGVKAGIHSVFSHGERAVIKSADPVVRSLATKEAAAIAPTHTGAMDKPRPVIEKARVEELVTAAKRGGFKDLAQAVKESDFNFDHIDTAADVKDTVDAFSAAFEKQISTATHGEKQTFGELKELADELGAGTDSLKALYQDTDNLGARILAHRALLTASAEKVTNLAGQVSGKIPMAEGLRSEEAIIALRKHVAMHAAIQAQMKGVQTEVGRALSQFRLQSSSVDLARNEVGQLIDALGGHEANVKFAEDLAKITNPKQLNAALRMGAMATTRGAITESIVMGKLWSPVTHVANSVGNLITVVGSLGERATASMIGKFTRRNGAIEMAEVKAQMFGLVGGMQDALKITSEGLAAMRDAAGQAGKLDFAGAKQTLSDNADEFGSAWKAMATGSPVGRSSMMGTVEDAGLHPAIGATAFGLDPAKLPGILADAFGTLTRIPGRPLAAADELFFAMHYRGELRAQAYRNARAKGLEGDALVNEIARSMTEPDATMRSTAVRAGQDGTFTTPLTGAQAKISSAINSANLGALPVGRLIVPFIRTPMNIMNYVGRRNPLTGFMAESYKADIAAGGARADMAHARIVMGSSLLMLGAVMASEMQVGDVKMKLHGGGDFKQSAEKLGGYQPYSLQVGDKFYAFNRLDPFGMFLGLSADFKDILGHLNQEGVEASDLVSASVLSIGRNLTSKSYLSGIIDGIQAMTEAQRGNTKSLSRYVNNEAAGALPFSSAFNVVRKVDDPVQREVWNMMDAIKNKLPGYSKDLPPQRNLFGEPVEFKAGLGPDIASPIQTTVKSSDPVASEIARLNIDLQMPPRSIAARMGSKAIDLSPKQYDMYTKVAGENFKEMATQAVTDSSWRDLPEDPGNTRYQDAKELTIKTLHNKAKEIAFAHLLEHDAKFAAAFEQNTENAAAVMSGSGRPKLPLPQ